MIQQTDNYHKLKAWAFSLFVNKKYDEAKLLLESKEMWLKEFIKDHFDNLENISFSYVTDKPFDYLKNNVLGIKEYSQAIKDGSEVHNAAERLLKGEEFELEERLEPFKNNIKELTEKIKRDFSEIYKVENNFTISLSDITEDDHPIKFSGKIDAIFKNENKFLILDWKTDKSMVNGSKHRQQLESYKKAFCYLHDIDAKNVEVGIAYIGLRNSINTGVVDYELDMRKPSKTAFKTFISKVDKILEWKKNPDEFLEELSGDNSNINHSLWRNVVEQYIFELNQNF